MKILLKILAPLALAASVSASEHTTCKRAAYAASAADLITTEIVIARGHGVEGNPLLSDNRAQRLMVKAALTAAMIEGGDTLQGSDSKFLKGLGKAMIHVSPFVWGGAVAWNIKVAW